MRASSARWRATGGVLRPFHKPERKPAVRHARNEEVRGRRVLLRPRWVYGQPAALRVQIRQCINDTGGTADLLIVCARHWERCARNLRQRCAGRGGARDKVLALAEPQHLVCRRVALRVDGRVQCASERFHKLLWRQDGCCVLCAV